jgi:DNA-binding SARP family transcriptional activator
MDALRSFPAVPVLRVRLFGGLSIDREDWPRPAVLSRAAETLFSYLILERQRSHARDEVAGLFWGDMPDDRARNCLNTALWRIRRVLEPDPRMRGMYVETVPSGNVRFNTASDYWLDVAVFEQALDASASVPPEQLETGDVSRLESAVELYVGDVLGGVFDDWALNERERLRARYVDAQVYLMRVHRARGNGEKALAYGRRVVAVDPLREEVHRELMGVYDDLGQSAQAIRQYELCRELLVGELGVGPKAETQALRARLGSFDGSEIVTAPSAADLRLALDLLSRAGSALRDAQRGLDEALRVVNDGATNGDASAVSAPRSGGDLGVIDG